MSRFRILATFATLAALATALAACGGGSGSDDPQAVVESATLRGVQSGNLDLTLHLESGGSEGGDLDVTLTGPFQGEGSGSLPKLDLEAKANGEVKGDAVDFEGGLTLLPDRAYVNYEGTEYEVDPTTFGFVKSALEQAEQGSEDAGNPNACQEAVTGLEVGDFATNLKSEGSADVDGTSTTKVSGELNAGKAIDALIELTEDPACSAQLEAAGPLPLGELEKARREVSTALKRSHVELYVGDDDIIRRLLAEFTIAPKGEDPVEARLDVTLGEVNETQDVGAPSSSKPLEDLFLKLGINPLELLEEASSGAGIGGLLEKLGSAAQGGSGGSSGGGESGGGSGSGGSGSQGSPSGGSGGGSDQSAYLQCLQNAKTPVDLQNCASLSG